MTWIYDFPAWALALVSVAIACVLVSAGLYVRLRYNRVEDIAHNDVAGAIVATAGTVVAVVLSFMVVVVWQEFDASAANVQREASAVADLHHVADDLPQPLRGKLRASLNAYVDLIINDEWKKMRHGGSSSSAGTTAYEIGQEVAAFAPATPAQAALQQQALALYQTFTDARRQRLADNSEGIPMVLWGTVLFATCAMIYLTFLFRIQNVRTHYIMTLVMTAIIMSILVLVAELDYPFRGDIGIAPTSFERMQASLQAVGLAPSPDY